ncbi:MAG: hypothetical protein ACRCVX_02275 [Shewanella sp.]
MDIKDFLPKLRKLIQGPLQTQMADELMTSAVSFCKHSRVIRKTFSVGDVSADDVFATTITEPGLKAWGTAIVMSEGEELKRDEHYTQESRDSIKFVKDASGVTVVVWAIPTDPKNFPDELEEFDDAICSGAAASMFLEHAKEWSNPVLYDVHHRRFVGAYRDAWREAESDQYGLYQNPTIKQSVWS